MFRVSRAATLVGIEAPTVGHVVDIKPYVTSGLSTDMTTTPRIHNDVTYSRRIGLDGGRLIPIDAGGRLTDDEYVLGTDTQSGRDKRRHELSHASLLQRRSVRDGVESSPGR
jgi:hypothetical protein